MILSQCWYLYLIKRLHSILHSIPKQHDSDHVDEEEDSEIPIVL